MTRPKPKRLAVFVDCDSEQQKARWEKAAQALGEELRVGRLSMRAFAVRALEELADRVLADRSG